jgi:hypothetical protein
MENAKQQVREVLDGLPDDCTLEDIQYHIYVRQKVVRSLEEADQGKTVSQEEAERRMQRWIAP